jgi:hypothetical protein
MFNLRGCAGFFDRLVPSLVRRLQTKAASRPVPPHTGDVCSHRTTSESSLLFLMPFLTDTILTPNDFLKAIGRSSEKKLSFSVWEDLWRVDRYQMKKAGVSVRDRR